jgi:hypothetical protein
MSTESQSKAIDALEQCLSDLGIEMKKTIVHFDDEEVSAFLRRLREDFQRELPDIFVS